MRHGFRTAEAGLVTALSVSGPTVGAWRSRRQSDVREVGLRPTRFKGLAEKFPVLAYRTASVSFASPIASCVRCRAAGATAGRGFPPRRLPPDGRDGTVRIARG